MENTNIRKLYQNFAHPLEICLISVLFFQVPELLREPKLEPINLNISSLLPEITPNYKPIALPIDQPKRLISEDEALSRVMANKNLRYFNNLIFLL